MRHTLKPLAEQSILITGASSGIGLVTAKAAAAAGARVTLVARNAEALEQAVREIAAAGGEAASAVADVADRAQVEAAAQVAIARFGGIDSWVNNAGVGIYAKLVDTPDDEHRRMVETNYWGSVNGCLTAVAHLREGGGALIQVGSIASDVPSPVLGAYAATKHAVKAYVEALRMELEGDGVPISVTLIKPAGIDTPIAENAAKHSGATAMVPAPVYDPVLVSDAILHACEHARRSITVGGAGRLQVLLGTHFPWVLDKLGARMTTRLTEPGKGNDEPGALFAPKPGGAREHSQDQPGRKVSLYTAGQLHPVAAGALGFTATAGAVALMLALKRKRREA